MKKVVTLIIILMYPIINISADEPKEIQLNKMIKEIYNFKPSKVSDKIRESKSKEMDKLWNLVESNKNEFIPLLRKELQNQNHNPFFYFDGSSLLLRVSSTKTDMQIVIDAISKSNLEDVQHLDYFQMVHWIACQNMNVYPAIENMLNTPDFEIFIPQHVIKLGQNYSVLYCLLCMNDDLYMDKLIQRLKIEKNPETVKTIILAIAYSVSEIGQKAINDYIESCKNPELKEYARKYITIESKNKLPKKDIKSKRKYFTKFLDDFVNREYESKEYNFKDYAEDAYYLIKKEDYTLIKNLRKKQAQTHTASDEVLSEIDFLTMLLQYSFTSED